MFSISSLGLSGMLSSSAMINTHAKQLVSGAILFHVNVISSFHRGDVVPGIFKITVVGGSFSGGAGWNLEHTALMGDGTTLVKFKCPVEHFELLNQKATDQMWVHGYSRDKYLMAGL